MATSSRVTVMSWHDVESSIFGEDAFIQIDYGGTVENYLLFHQK